MKILIIEDEKPIIELLRQGLEAEMFSVESASDGERGSFLARTGSYDLIILDYCLPKLSGPEVLKEIRQEKNHVPIIMLTVKSELENKKEVFSLGADDYLTKPFLFAELLIRIRAILKRPNKIEEEIYQVDNLIFNTKTKTVKRGEKEIYFTRREFSLLEYLLRHKDMVVSRQQILENVWDYNADPFSNSIESHIASLRRKLNKNKNRNLIHTFSGRGYKLSTTKLN